MLKSPPPVAPGVGNENRARHQRRCVGLAQSQGNSAQVLKLALAGAVQVCHDERILAEYAEVLARPRFKFDPKRVREVLSKLEADSLAVDASKQPDLNLPDPDDEPFLAVALAASADFLVTGNLSDYPAGKRRGFACGVHGALAEVAIRKVTSARPACPICGDNPIKKLIDYDPFCGIRPHTCQVPITL